MSNDPTATVVHLDVPVEHDGKRYDSVTVRGVRGKDLAKLDKLQEDAPDRFTATFRFLSALTDDTVPVGAFYEMSVKDLERIVAAAGLEDFAGVSA